MKNLIYVLAVSLLILSCVSENQQKALDEIALVYDAKTSYSKGVSKSVGDKTVSYFRVLVSESDIIDSMRPEIAAGNIALMVYANFNDEEKKKITHVEVDIIPKSDPKNNVMRSFLVEELEVPYLQSRIFDNFSKVIINNDFVAMAAMIDPQYRHPEDADNISAYIHQHIAVNGPIKEYRRLGYGLQIFEDKTQNFQYNGHFVFENDEKLNYAVETYDKANNDYIYRFEIK